MKVGFTGTRRGMTEQQTSHVILILNKLHREDKITEVAHGDCVGADAEFHRIVNSDNIKVVLHPAIVDEQYKARCLPFSRRWNAAPPLIRNRNIVDSTDVLIAAPRQDHEVSSGGTWFTVRYARKQKRDNLHMLAGWHNDKGGTWSIYELKRSRIPMRSTFLSPWNISILIGRESKSTACTNC